MSKEIDTQFRALWMGAELIEGHVKRTWKTERSPLRRALLALAQRLRDEASALLPPIPSLPPPPAPGKN